MHSDSRASAELSSSKKARNRRRYDEMRHLPEYFRKTSGQLPAAGKLPEPCVSHNFRHALPDVYVRGISNPSYIYIYIKLNMKQYVEFELRALHACMPDVQACMHAVRCVLYIY